MLTIQLIISVLEQDKSGDIVGGMTSSFADIPVTSTKEVMLCSTRHSRV